jgi:transmembrane sensor
VPPAEPEDVEALIERARTTPNVVAISPSPHRSPETRHAPGSLLEALKSSFALFSFLSRRRELFTMAATLMLTLLGAGAYLYSQRNTYVTDIGEQRSILLTDGSTIDLNARSKVRVLFGEHERHIELLEGQALFSVAKDKTRPFVVAANGTRVRAVGTQFDVNQRKRGLVVTVVEGTVAVSSAAVAPSESRELEHAPRSVIAAGPGEILLDAGQQLTLAQETRTAAQSPAIPQHADVDTATAWTERRLIFDATPLEDVVEEFNRNNTRPLVIEGPGLEDFHVSGAFSSTDSEPLLRFLRAQSGIRVIDQRDRIVVSRSE